jgi:outer membrane protein insertion porin family
VQVLADDGTARADLVKRAKIRVGDPFDRGRMLQGGDRIRAALQAAGYIQAIVHAEATPDAGPPPAHRVVYRVAAGPKVAVELVMRDGKGKRTARKTLMAFRGETPYTPDFWDEATRALLEEMQQRGYYAADLTWSATDGPSGRTVRILVDRGKPVRLRAVRLTGTTSIPRERFEKQMTSLRVQALRKRLLRPSVLTEDLAAVRALYREEGFTQVRIGQPQITLSATGDSAEVDVAVQEGPRFAIGDLSFSKETAASDEQLRAWTPLASGVTFSPRRLAEAEQALKERFDALGYPDVNVESQVGLGLERADIAFDVAAGERKTVGEVVIEGNRVTKDRTIARALTFGRGEFLSNQSLLESQQRLYRTGLFSNVKLICVPAGGDDPAAQKVTVKVEEAPPLALGLGVGYDSADGPRASFLVGYSNLGGRNLAIAVQGRFSGKENRELLTLRRRRVFGKSIDALGSVLFEKTAREAFTESRRALSIRIEQRPKPRWIRFLRYSIQDVQISGVTDVQAALDEALKDKVSAVQLADVGLGLVRDTRDDAFLPTRGGYGSIEGSVFAKPLGSQVSFAKLFLRGSWTVSLKRGSRFASFLRVGAEQPFADTQIVPLSERFFAGGSNTIRGFATDSVEPVGGLGSQDLNTGGEALLVLNEEWHFPIWRSLRGELFLDAGNVYRTLSDFDLTDLRSSAGVGVRLDTPVGPIRVEYGWKLNRKPDESSGELTFSIGTVF